MKVPEKVMAAARERMAFLIVSGKGNHGHFVVVKDRRDYIFLDVVGNNSFNLSKNIFISPAEAFRLAWGKAVISGQSCRVEI